MKALFTAAAAGLALAFFATLAHAEAPGGCAKVEVQNLRTGQGPLMVAAYTDVASFRKTAASQLQLAVTGETMAIQVCGLTGDTVALTAYQDLNANGKMDANPFGMPTEPWGASGKVAMMGPSWDSAQVPLGTETLVVKLSK
ncbi:DUF2141 domain-containing protein [Ideonella azotifigens]|uniref:DUF2141 domain-containing protein n=1 Tax=Ideonella azotifigens TaxID=513160 RepID=A0ABP3UTF7_9BURK|nr:DUF2141 domain-containing protein [Ideonella azotifigens]MCD2341943.1 DUF2141 domain-containing protein [Ideonella azotifigens]